MTTRLREPVAIIGMSGRFPGAKSVDELWANLRGGVESIGRIPEAVVEARRDPRGNLPPNFVPMGSHLADTEWFDPHFFGVTLRDAKLWDPQQRLFIEHAWAAVEDAGYDVNELGERVAVYAGGGPSRHVLDALDVFGHDAGTLFEVVATGVANAMAMRASHLFNLRGESIYIYTACSTSLVALDMACRAVLDGRADVALAGGTALWLPQQEGYEHVPGMILSSDGHCRAFDARADGTVWGNGVAVVVVKPLARALADRDPVRAVVLGSAVNNDGRFNKFSFAAPSAQGQAQVIRAAYEECGVAPDTITYVEAHGTGTTVGDPLEVEGLHLAFGRGAGQNTCALGSVKTNIGHLDPVAGLASVAKTVLSMEHGEIPATLHFRRPNPAIDFAAGPFFVNAELRPWGRRGGLPRRAGVNSFGVGGTNAHVILEERPAPPPAEPSARPSQLVTLSARSPKAVAAMARDLKAHLEARPGLALEDVAFTRAVGRRQFDHRLALVARDVPSLLRALEAPPAPVHASFKGGAKVAFLFPGQGSQAAGMAEELYRCEPEFRRDVDDCAEVLEGALGLDVRALLFAGAEGREAAEAKMRQTAVTQPLLFVVEYALARQWGRWGVAPDAMLGHSVGEYVAACLAGVFNPGEALLLLAERGRLVQAAPPGDMLAVGCSEAELAPLLGPALDLAAVNGPAQCVASGPPEAIAALEAAAAAAGVASTRLRTSHAFHSALLDEVVPRFEAAVRRFKPKPPKVPFVSNVTGAFITDAQAVDPRYWAQHLRAPVRFWAGVEALRAAGHRVFLEVGPGRALSRLLGAHPPEAPELVRPSLRAPKGPDSDYDAMLRALGDLWSHRVSIKWRGFWADERRNRVRLPPYPFEKVWCALYQPGEEFKLVEKALGGQRLGGSVVGPREGGGAEAEAEGGGGGRGDEAPARRPGERPPSYGRPYVEPRDENERKIAEVFGRALGIDRLGADDDLMELGGHSLMLVAITNHLRAMFDVPIPARVVIENPTPAALAEAIAELVAQKGG
jgi:acyl transferase domain-containing protein